jgi:Fe-S-cluster containining protein
MKKTDQSNHLEEMPLVNALAMFHTLKQEEVIETLMEGIPGGTCDSCGACCHDNVPLSAVEFMRIVSRLHEGDLLAEAVQKAQDWYLNQFDRVQPCIFLVDNLCTIYNQRPLTCRLFGHQSSEEQDKRVKKVLQQNKVLASDLKKQFGIEVNQAVVNHAIVQCGFVPEKNMTKAQQDLLYDQVQALDAPYYLKGFIDENWINLTMIEWFVLVFLDEDVLLERILSK